VQFASITKRVAKLGSEKWTPHLRAKKMAKIDPDVILLTIGQPDIQFQTNSPILRSRPLKKVEQVIPMAEENRT